MWIQDYPHDFLVGSSTAALNALIKSIISKTHLLHYGSDFLPFLEDRPKEDTDAAWALKVDESPGESDDSFSVYDDGEDRAGAAEHEPEVETDSPSSLKHLPPSNGNRKSSASRMPSTMSARERKSSLPLTAKELSGIPTLDTPEEVVDMTPKQTIKELLRISQELSFMDPNDIAQEITRIETMLFLEIQVRLFDVALAAGMSELNCYREAETLVATYFRGWQEDVQREG